MFSLRWYHTTLNLFSKCTTKRGEVSYPSDVSWEWGLLNSNHVRYGGWGSIFEEKQTDIICERFHKETAM